MSRFTWFQSMPPNGGWGSYPIASWTIRALGSSVRGGTTPAPRPPGPTAPDHPRPVGGLAGVVADHLVAHGLIVGAPPPPGTITISGSGTSPNRMTPAMADGVAW